MTSGSPARSSSGLKGNSRQRLIGVKGAKSELSRMLADVKAGREWTITKHGVPVARLVPISRDVRPLEEWLSHLEARGVLGPAPQNPRPLPPPLPDEMGLARRMLEEDRGSLG